MLSRSNAVLPLHVGMCAHTCTHAYTHTHTNHGLLDMQHVRVGKDLKQLETARAMRISSGERSSSTRCEKITAPVDHGTCEKALELSHNTIAVHGSPAALDEYGASTAKHGLEQRVVKYLLPGLEIAAGRYSTVLAETRE